MKDIKEILIESLKEAIISQSKLLEELRGTNARNDDSIRYLAELNYLVIQLAEKINELEAKENTQKITININSDADSEQTALKVKKHLEEAIS